jgi:hypothetical protein
MLFQQDQVEEVQVAMLVDLQEEQEQLIQEVVVEVEELML